MSSTSDFELLRLVVRNANQFAAIRLLARRAALLVGLDTPDATRVATSISEIGRVTRGRTVVRLVVETDPRAAASVLVVSVQFAGVSTGVLDVGQDAHTVVSRLMDRVEVTDDVVRLVKSLARPVDEQTLVAARDELLVQSPGGLRTVLESQNEELIAALTALRERETELVSVNAELAQTNRGVLALYAELEQRAGEVREAQRIVFEELGRTLRPPPPDVAGLELAVRYLPAQADSPTGGDLYDWLVLPDGSLHIAVVDVQGHGVTGTRDALSVTHVIRTLTLEGHPLPDLLSRADTVLQAAGNNVVATAFVARFDPRTGELELAAAGHPPALRLSASGEGTYLETQGRPLGYALDARDGGRGGDGVARTCLVPGDSLLMYTDGLVEIRRDILEGLETLEDAARKAAGMAMPALLDTVLAACTRGDALRDDTLLLAMRWNP